MACAGTISLVFKKDRLRDEILEEMPDSEIKPRTKIVELIEQKLYKKYLEKDYEFLENYLRDVFNAIGWKK